MRFFNLYQYLAPLILLPASYFLWWDRMDRSHPLALFMLSVPVLLAYVVPALGMNWLRLWEMNTRIKLGHFRPHHGFVFGSAISLGALICVGPPTPGFSWYGMIQAAFVTGSVMAFWNWFYDLYAIKAGFLIVHIRPFADGRGAEATATEYAPVYFGTFGACYGLAIYLGQHVLLTEGRMDLFWIFLLGFNALTLTLPTLLYVLASFLRYGEAGIRPVYASEPTETIRTGGPNPRRPLSTKMSKCPSSR